MGAHAASGYMPYGQQVPALDYDFFITGELNLSKLRNVEITVHQGTVLHFLRV